MAAVLHVVPFVVPDINLPLVVACRPRHSSACSLHPPQEALTLDSNSATSAYYFILNCLFLSFHYGSRAARRPVCNSTRAAPSLRWLVSFCCGTALRPPFIVHRTRSGSIPIPPHPHFNLNEQIPLPRNLFIYFAFFTNKQFPITC